MTQMKYHDGNSPAAWTAVGLGILGSVVAALAFPLNSNAVFVAGCVIVVLGLVVGKLMAMAGYGNVPVDSADEPGDTVLEGPTRS